jgi:diadenosine tetraphosphatase ApaH/serine/threonine PP2A family protein phosphatase
MLPAVAVRMVGVETLPEDEKVADPVHGGKTDDAARWWRAYQLAENDQVDELRRLAAAGDDHARRQLAGWLSDRAFPGGPAGPATMEEAIDVIRPLANAGDDVAELWLARWLADCDRLDELRERAGTGGYHASRELARLLAGHDMLDELRDRVSAGGGHYALRELARRLIEGDMHEELRELLEAADAGTRPLILDAVGGASPEWMNAVRVLADFGHKASRWYLARTLAREGRLEELRQRAGHGDEYARHWLDEALSR